MEEEILQKTDAKLARLEEENKRKDKEIEDLQSIVKTITAQMDGMAKLLEVQQEQVNQAQETQKKHNTRMLELVEYNKTAELRLIAAEEGQKANQGTVEEHTKDISKLSEIIGLMKKTHKEIKMALKRNTDTATKSWVLSMIDEQSQAVNRLALKNNKDLRDFADDLEVALRSMKFGGTMSSKQDGGSAGKIHFRCLTCDRPLKDVNGPRSKGYMQQMSKSSSSSGTTTLSLGHHGITTRSTGRKVDVVAGDEYTLYGEHGDGVFKGRQDDGVHAHDHGH